MIKLKRVSKRMNDIFGMASLNPQKSGLGDIVIWSDHGGVLRKVSHKNTPRIEIGQLGGYSISVTIEAQPRIKAKSPGITKKELDNCRLGMEYVGRNYDLFLKHYFDTEEEFDDEDLFNALKARGEYK